jgi:hypothetical protein
MSQIVHNPAAPVLVLRQSVVQDGIVPSTPGHDFAGAMEGGRWWPGA